MTMAMNSEAAGGGASVVLEPETETLVAAMTPEPDFARQIVINNLIVALKAGGIWPLLDILYVFAAHAQQPATLNWKAPANFVATPVSSPTFTVDRGFSGNGASAYLAPGWSPSDGPQYQQDSAHVSGWSLSPGSASATEQLVGTSTGTSPDILLGPRFTGDLFRMIVNDGTASSTIASTNRDGFFIANRSGASARQGYRNGASLGSDAVASTGETISALTFLRNGAATFASLLIAQGSTGASLSAPQASSYYNALLNYMQAVGSVPVGFVAKGDSLTAGFSANTNCDYPRDLSRMLGIILTQNFGVGGQTVATANVNYPTEGGVSFNPATADTYLFMMGTNDAASVDAATVLSRIQTHINLALATGYKVALGTIPKRGENPTAQAVLNAVNPSLRANYLAMGAKWLMDFDAWPTLQDPNNTTYYNPDKLHLNNAGYLELAKCAQAGLGVPVLSQRGPNGALRYRPNPPGWRLGTPPSFNIATMQTCTLSNNTLAVLNTPVTAKTVYGFQMVSGVGSFTTAGVMVVGGDGDNNMGFGPGTASGAGWYNNAGVFQNSASPNSGLGGFTSGDTVGVVIDPIAKKIWWTKDGTNFTGIGTAAVSLANVIAGTGSTAQTWAGDVYPGVGAWNAALTVVVNSVPYPWTPPTGFDFG